MNERQTAQGQVRVDLVDGIAGIGIDRRQTAGGHDPHGAAVFRLDARHQALDQADITPIDARLHGRHRVLADDALRPFDGNPRQQRRGAVERLDRMLHGRRDDATLVGPVGADHVEGGGRSEIDDDERAAEGLVSGHRIHQAIGADVGRRGGPHFDPQIDPGRADDHRLGLEVPPAQGLQRIAGGGHDVGEYGAVDLGRSEVLERHQLREPDRIFVGGAPGVARRAPPAPLLLVLVDGEDHVGVAGIDREQHRVGPFSRSGRRRPRRRCGYRRPAIPG